MNKRLHTFKYLFIDFLTAFCSWSLFYIYRKTFIEPLGLGYNIPIAVLQRFGYILENILKKKELADSLYKVLQKKINRIMPLDYSSGIKGFKCKNRWKIIENKNLEIEL